MYRAEEWRDGWLWVKSSPYGNWWPANTDEVIRALAGKVQALEARLAERQTQPEARQLPASSTLTNPETGATDE